MNEYENNSLRFRSTIIEFALMLDCDEIEDRMMADSITFFVYFSTEERVFTPFEEKKDSEDATDKITEMSLRVHWFKMRG